MQLKRKKVHGAKYHTFQLERRMMAMQSSSLASNRESSMSHMVENGPDGHEHGDNRSHEHSTVNRSRKHKETWHHIT